MSEHPELGRVGVWIAAPPGAELARGLEQLGYGAIWIGGSQGGRLAGVETTLAATSRLTVATGVVNIWKDDAASIAASYHRLADRYPGRFLLGVGAGHPEAISQYTKPYDALVHYLDALDAGGVPPSQRALAALGPKVLRLAADRTAGAHPYLVTPEHTRRARKLLGPDALLAPEQHVVLDADIARGRDLARTALSRYLDLTNYTNNWRRLGFTEEDITGQRQRSPGRRTGRSGRRDTDRLTGHRAPRRRRRPRLHPAHHLEGRGPADRLHRPRQGPVPLITHGRTSTDGDHSHTRGETAAGRLCHGNGYGAISRDRHP